MLLERNGGLVTRGEIKKKLWPNDTIVEFDVSISQAIRRLRQALEDSAENPKYVETVARRGYRLMVPAKWIRVDGSSGPTPNSSSPGKGDDARSGSGVRMELRPVLTGRTVSHYRVLDIIGGGGMGVVYRAEDLKLGRQVALKFLPEELGSEPQALERFSREARAASSLDHPNICPIHEFGEHEGRPFIVMQLLEGQTLRDRLARGERALPLAELLDIGIQVSGGLQAAHEKGIIHRDIKPANIFLTSKGVVKILDFGLAKLIASTEAAETPIDLSSRAEVAASATGAEGPAVRRALENADPSTPCHPDPQKQRVGEEGRHSARDDSIKVADPTLTRTGLAMGTAGYMSPEQVRGEKLDARTDIFSFGLVLYEMACGQRAFTGQTAAVVHEALLTQTPTPLRDLNSGLPSKLVGTIDKALEKDRERRYQSAAEMHEGLDSLKERSELAQAPARQRRWAWVWLASAVLLMASAAAGRFAWRSHNRLKLTDKDTIVLADFVNNTGDSVFDAALTGGLREHLGQTPFFNILVPDKIRAALKALKYPQNAKLTPELARAVCKQTGSRAFVVGSISDVGNEYQIELEAADCQASNRDVTAELQAEGRDQIVKTLGMATDQLRMKLGEPDSLLKKFHQPLEVAMSSSVEALQAFKLGEKTAMEGDLAKGISYFTRAVAIDPSYARAYAAVGNGLADRSLKRENLTKAYQLLSRASERQRYYIEGHYYDQVTGEADKTLTVYRLWAQSYPNDFNPHVLLAEKLPRLGALEEAAAEAREGIRLSPENNAAVAAMLWSDVNLDQLDEAKSLFAAFQKRGDPGSNCRVQRYYIAFLEKDNSGMQEQLAWAVGRAADEADFTSMAADTEAYYGHLAKALRFSQNALNADSRYQSAEGSGGYIAVQSLREAEVEHLNEARSTAKEALRLNLGGDGRVLAALALARTGDTGDAEEIADKLNVEFPLETVYQKYWLPTIRASIDMQKGMFDKALEQLAVVLPYDRAMPPGILPNYYPVYLRGLAYLHAKDGQHAATELQKIVDHSYIALNFVTAALAHLQLGRAQVMMGDKVAARKSYQEFLSLWKDADPDVPIYKQAKAEYAKLH
jgi:serine/threonine protein kinase